MKILAVDLGKARTGLALCDEGEILASPAGVITQYNREKLVGEVAQKARELGAREIVVGLPRNMDGSEGARAQKARKLAQTVQAVVPIPVEMWDERSTTVTAASILSENGTFGKKRKEKLDAVAATVILESYLRYKHNLEKTQP